MRGGVVTGAPFGIRTEFVYPLIRRSLQVSSRKPNHGLLVNAAEFYD